MDPGHPLTRAHLKQISDFLAVLAEVYAGELFADVKGDTRIWTLRLPAATWRGLSISIKSPINPAYPDLDITVRSAVSEPTLLSTKDESLAKMFLSSVLQMYEPKEERF